MLGGELKRREKLSARFGDVLSALYLSSCVLKRFEDDQRPADDLPLVHWNVQQELYTIQTRMDEILAHFPSRSLGWVLRRVLFPWGRRWQKPSDQLGHECASLLLQPSPSRDRLTAGMFISYDAEDATGVLEHALPLVLAAEPIEHKLSQADFSGTLEQAVVAGLMTMKEAEQLHAARAAVHEVIKVDDFAPEELTVQREAPEPVHALAS